MRSTDDPTEREALQAQLAHHKKILVKNLLHAVKASSRNRKQVMIEKISLLHRLGETSAGRETFFDSRKELIKARSRQMAFDGDVVNYVAELALITFTIIKQSAEWFRAAFTSTNKASGECRKDNTRKHAKAPQDSDTGRLSKSRRLRLCSGDKSTLHILKRT